MCMQTNFGACLIDGKVVEKNKKQEIKKIKNSKKKQKKVIHQSKVEFE